MTGDGGASIEDAIAAAWDPDRPADTGILGTVLAEPARQAVPEDEPAFDPFALADERRSRETESLQRALLEHELYSAYPGLRGHDAALMAAASMIGEMETGSPEVIRETAKRLGEAASRLIGDVAARVRHDEAKRRPVRTAGIGGGSQPPAHKGRRQEPKPLTMCDAIKAAQKKRGLY